MNEFKIKNGFFSEGDSNITGSFLITGDVGIGTTSPGYKLDVNGTFHTTGDATFNGTNFTVNSSFLFIGNDVTDLVSIAGNTMYFPGNGFVGIGTSTPSVKLDTVGYVKDTKYVTADQEPASIIDFWSGDVIEGSIHGSVSTWDLISLDADGTWYQADNTNVNSTYMLGIYLGSDLVLLEGHITVQDSGVNGPYVQAADEGLPIYMRDGGAGGMSTTLPTTTGNYVRILGHAYYRSGGEAGNYIMKFRPSNDWIQL